MTYAVPKTTSGVIAALQWARRATGRLPLPGECVLRRQVRASGRGRQCRDLRLGSWLATHPPQSHFLFGGAFGAVGGSQIGNSSLFGGFFLDLSAKATCSASSQWTASWGLVVHREQEGHRERRVSVGVHHLEALAGHVPPGQSRVIHQAGRPEQRLLESGLRLSAEKAPGHSKVMLQRR